MTDALARERAHQDAWYQQAIDERIFEREGFRHLIARNLRLLREAVPFSPSSRVLSIGCGTGEYELLLAPHVDCLRGVDLSSVAIEEATRRAATQGVRNVDFQAGPVLETTFNPRSFDVIYALGVLHHLPETDRQRLLLNVRSWLAPGGWFYARDPNARGLLRRAAGRCFANAAFNSPNEAALDPASVRHELRHAGFVDMAVRYTDVMTGPLPWILESRSRLLWSAVHGIDRVWLAIPGLQSRASQFDISCRRPPE